MDGQRAVVVPRAFAPESGEPLALEDLVAPLLDAPAPGLIAVLGPAGFGKTTALRHLAARWPDARMHDAPATEYWSGLVKAARERLVVYAATHRLPGGHRAVLTLVPWSTDEWIEYLLAAHPERCKAVMARVGQPEQPDRLGGSPELWSAVLDALAADPALPDVEAALRAPFTGDERCAGAISLDCTPKGNARSRTYRLLRGAKTDPRARLIRHRPVQVALASRDLVRRLREGRGLGVLKRVPAADVLAATGPLIAAEADARTVLQDCAKRPKRQAAAASLLHAARIAWRPPRQAELPDARLPGIAWPDVDLTRARLARADLTDADLTRALLVNADLEGAHLAGARLRGAMLGGFDGRGADLRRADLTEAHGRHACFARARLSAADLRRSDLPDADFTKARLVRACLAGARVERAAFRGAELRGADLSAACLDGANLADLYLRRTTLVGASFRLADLRGARLDGAHLPGAAMQRAVLTDTDLTDAHMPGADLRAANLNGARVANVNWERADLREADLRRADFHMGSSRSGLVDSPIASEGTRTGFYTDDFDEMHFKAPEEIRKANLRGADLRGAKVEDTDFYLVDLREARYDDDQAEHFRRCGAILRGRA